MVEAPDRAVTVQSWLLGQGRLTCFDQAAAAAAFGSLLGSGFAGVRVLNERPSPRIDVPFLLPITQALAHNR